MPQILRGYESVARFLGVGRSTVVRWRERYPDFPLRKESGSPWGKVWAGKADLVAWAARHDKPLEPRRP